MARGTAVIATTNRLPNGYKFSRADLERFAEAYRARLLVDPYLNYNHRYDHRPVAKAINVWVSQHPGDPQESALLIEFQTLPDADPEEVARQFATGAFSISFFGLGVSNTSGEDDQEDLTIGFSPELGGELELDAMLRDVIRVVPDARVSVRHFHQHAAEPGTAVIVVFGLWLMDKVGSKIIDKLWSVLFEPQEAPARQADQLLAHIRTANGEVHIQMPISDATAEMQKALADGIRDVFRQNAGEGPTGRVSISYNLNYEPTVHQLPSGNNAGPNGSTT
ncbi:MAG TPA: hypothetical protein VF647_02310 [Longimicrobium sp.]|jgi:hypothetical protein